MAEQRCGIEFAPGVACSRVAGHDLPEFPDLDRGQWSERSTIVSDRNAQHRFEWVIPDPEPTSPDARQNLRSVTHRYLQLPIARRKQILEELGIERGLYGGEGLAVLRERHLIEQFADAVDAQYLVEAETAGDDR